MSNKTQRVSEDPHLPSNHYALGLSALIDAAHLDWYYRGMRTLIPENSYLRIISLVDKGSEMMRLLFKPLVVDLLFHTPTGYKVTLWDPLEGLKENSWDYGGGWQHVLPLA